MIGDNCFPHCSEMTVMILSRAPRASVQTTGVKKQPGNRMYFSEIKETHLPSFPDIGALHSPGNLFCMKEKNANWRLYNLLILVLLIVETSCLKIQPFKFPLPRGCVEGYVAGGEEQVLREEREQAKGNLWVRASARFMQHGLVFLLLLAEKSWVSVPQMQPGEI